MKTIEINVLPDGSIELTQEKKVIVEPPVVIVTSIEELETKRDELILQRTSIENNKKEAIERITAEYDTQIQDNIDTLEDIELTIATAKKGVTK